LPCPSNVAPRKQLMTATLLRLHIRSHRSASALPFRRSSISIALNFATDRTRLTSTPNSQATHNALSKFWFRTAESFLRMFSPCGDRMVRQRALSSPQPYRRLLAAESSSWALFTPSKLEGRLQDKPSSWNVSCAGVLGRVGSCVLGTGSLTVHTAFAWNT